MDEIRRDLLTEAALAELLGVKPRTLRRWRQLNEGPPWVPLGRGVRYLRGAVLTWLADRQTRPDDAPGRGQRG